MLTPYRVGQRYPFMQFRFKEGSAATGKLPWQQGELQAIFFLPTRCVSDVLCVNNVWADDPWATARETGVKLEHQLEFVALLPDGEPLPGGNFRSTIHLRIPSELCLNDRENPEELEEATLLKLSTLELETVDLDNDDVVFFYDLDAMRAEAFHHTHGARQASDVIRAIDAYRDGPHYLKSFLRSCV